MPEAPEFGCRRFLLLLRSSLPFPRCLLLQAKPLDPSASLCLPLPCIPGCRTRNTRAVEPTGAELHSSATLGFLTRPALDRPPYLAPIPSRRKYSIRTPHTLPDLCDSSLLMSKFSSDVSCPQRLLPALFDSGRSGWCIPRWQ